jgi:hypothetical protein
LRRKGDVSERPEVRAPKRADLKSQIPTSNSQSSRAATQALSDPDYPDAPRGNLIYLILKRGAGEKELRLLLLIAVLFVGCSKSKDADMSKIIEENEKKVVGFLREIYEAEKAFKKAGIIDEDEDSLGEYGFIVELTLAVTERFSKKPEAGFLPKEFGLLNTYGWADRFDYQFQLFLYGEGDKTITHSKEISRKKPLIDLREESYIVYAVPNRRGVTGNHYYSMDHTGRIFSITRDKLAHEDKYTGIVIDTEKTMNEGIIIDGEKALSKGWECIQDRMRGN